MNYDPVHDIEMPSSPIKAPETAHSVSISSLLTNDDNGQSIVATPETNETPLETPGDAKKKKEKKPKQPSEAKTKTTTKKEAAPTTQTKTKTYQTLLIKSRSRHLKKTDGEPFWRKDIQYEFLKDLFTNEEKVFTNPYDDGEDKRKLNFIDLYIRTIAESSKCSRILKDRLLTDKIMARAVGMVCLLVNVGRMNTTVNFVPEMRSQLRTYHSIPVLQVNTNSNTKTLQDTPRLKSILKSVCEENDEPKDMQELFARSEKKHKSNAINLIFLMSSYENEVKFLSGGGVNDESKSESPEEKEERVAGGGDFFDFFLNAKIRPKCRAMRFLWLMYTYLETNLTEEQLLSNPFGDGVNTTIPPNEYIDEDEEYDIDTEEEKKYGLEMIELRKVYLGDEEHNSTPKRGRHPVKKHNLEDKEGDASSSLLKKTKKAAVSAVQVNHSVSAGSDTPEHMIISDFSTPIEKNTKLIKKTMTDISASNEESFLKKKFFKGLASLENLRLQNSKDFDSVYNKFNEFNKYRQELIKKANERYFSTEETEPQAIKLNNANGELKLSF